jgi:ABC-type antimicrobial peptide transport system permease subunit
VETGGRSYTIVGVVRTSLSDAFGEPPTPAMYFSYRDRMSSRGELHLRTVAGREESLAPGIRRVVAELDPLLPVYDIRTLNQHVDRNLFLKRIPAQMFAVLGPLILLLAAVGIYAVVAYAVAQRTGEIGIRMALGATESRIVRQMVLDAMQVIGFGVAAGAILGLTIGGRLSTSGSVPRIVAIGIPALILAVGALACWLPARRASRVDALEALRWE